MVPDLSFNSSFQSLVIHNITCTHLNAFNIPCPLHIGCITIINIMTAFYIPISTWYEVSYLYHSMEFVISKLLPTWVILTPLTWPLWLVLAGDCRICSPNFVMDLLPYPFLHRVADHTLSASATYLARSMSLLVLPLMPTSKQWLSLVVHYKYIISSILTNHAISYACNTYPHAFYA